MTLTMEESLMTELMKVLNNTQYAEMELPFKVSTNKIYAGCAWQERERYKQKMIQAGWQIKGKLKPVESADVEFYFEFKGRPLDCDNVSFLAKLILDVLRHQGILKDDSPKYVKSVRLSSRKGEKDKVLIVLIGA